MNERRRGILDVSGKETPRSGIQKQPSLSPSRADGGGTDVAPESHQAVTSGSCFQRVARREAEQRHSGRLCCHRGVTLALRLGRARQYGCEQVAGPLASGVGGQLDCFRSGIVTTMGHVRRFSCGPTLPFLWLRQE